MVIAGGGRVGSQIAQVLKRLGRQFVVIELDQFRVEQAKVAGMSVVYGDASQEIVLEAAGIRSACLLLITTPGIVVARAIAVHARRLNRQIEIVARVSAPEFVEVFKKLKVTELVEPEFEAALEMTRQALLHLAVPVPEIQRYTEALRQESAAPLVSRSGQYKTLTELRAAEQQFALQRVFLDIDNADSRKVG